MTSRSSAFLALAAAAVAGAFLLLGRAPDPSAQPEDAERDTVDPKGPLLQARPTGDAASETSGPTFPIQGIVVDGRDKPVAWVRVEATRESSVRRTAEELAFGSPEPRSVVAEATSDVDGRFRLAVRPRGLVRLIARPAAPLVGTSQDVEGPAGTVWLRVVQGAPLRVRVLDRDDRGVKGWVTAWSRFDRSDRPRPGGEWSVWDVPTDADGRRVLDVPGGPLVFAVTVPGRGSRWGIPVLAPTDDEVVLRVLEAGGATVEGRVVDTGGRPVPDALVTVESRTATFASASGVARSDARGEYRIEGLPAGRYDEGQASAKGYIPARGHASAPALVEGQVLRVEFVLLRGTVVTGRALGEGTGVPGATVSLGSTERLVDRVWDPPGPATADANGTYRFDAVPPGRFTLRVQASGWIADPDPSGEVVVGAGGGEVVRDATLRRAPFAEGVGVVLDESRSPVAGATVTARQDPYRFATSTPDAVVSAADGTFSFSLDPRASWSFEARTPTHLAMVGPRPASQTWTSPVELVLRRGVRLGGRVVRLDGSPVAGAAVAVDADVQEHLLGQTPTVEAIQRRLTADLDGRFFLEGLPPGTYVIGAGRGFEQATRNLGWGDAFDVELRGGLAPPILVLGKVVDESGSPLRGLHVFFRNLRSHDDTSHAVTDAGGDFRAQVGAPVEYVAGIESYAVSETVVGGAPPKRIVARPKRLRLLQGTVVDADGAPVPRARVHVQLDPPGTMGWATEASGGRFWVEVGGTAEPLIVTVSGAHDWAGTPLDTQSWRREGVNPAVGPLAVVLAKGLAFAGRVVGPDGRGVPGVGVSARSMGSFEETKSTRTDADGAFRLDGFSEGDLYVQVEPASGWVKPQVPAAKAGTTDLTMRLERGAVLEGRVIGPRGEPVPGAFVQASTSAASASATTEADGRFRMEGVPDAPVDVWARGPEEGPLRFTYLARKVPGVRPRSGPVDVRLEEGVTIEGEVVDVDGRPVANGTVWAQTRSGIAPRASTSGAGRFTVGPLEPGPHTLVFAGAGEVGSARIDVVAPAKGVRIQAGKALFVEGRVVGESIQGFQIAFHVPPGRGSGTHLDSSGRFSLKVDDNEVGTLYAFRDGDDRYAFLDGVRPGNGPHTMRLEPGAAISGSVDVPPPHKGWVWLRDLPRGINKNVPLGEDGTFKFRGLPPGTYSISGHHEAAQSSLGEVQVAAGTTGVLLKGRVPANR